MRHGKHGTKAQRDRKLSRILELARNAREWPDRWLAMLLSSQGLDAKRGILAESRSVPEQGGMFYGGLWVDLSPRFFAFEVTDPYDPAEPLIIERFEEITKETVVSDRLSGVQRSFSPWRLKRCGS